MIEYKKKLAHLVILVITINLYAQNPPPNKGYELLYEDNFDGDTLNTNDWAYRVGRRTGGGYINGVNLKKNVNLKDGALRIAVKHEIIDGQYENTGGGVISKLNFGYGYYECLSKPFMAGTGVHTSFWQASSLRENNNIFEIDSYEIDSKSKMGCNNLYVHLKTKEARVPWVHRAQVPYVADKDGWILDAYEYTPNGVIFYDDGKIVAKAEWEGLTAQQAIWLTALNGVGKVDTAALPGESLFKYFRYYAKDYPGINLLPNGNFEYNQDAVNSNKPIAWTPSGDTSSINIVKGNSARDQYKLKISSDKNFDASIQQKLEFIRNGEYILTAKVRSSCKVGTAKMSLNGIEYEVLIPKTKKWKHIELNGVKISNNEAIISITAKGGPDDWIEIDDINFMKPVLKEQQVENNKKPFSLFKDEIWGLAYVEPIVFTGNDKFYFFDRIVGYGEAISVAFTLKADKLANMTPIARIPKNGNSGWSIGLSEEGSLIFRIGSQENHTDVIAKNVYAVDQTCSIVCQYNKGTASVYLNGKMLKTVSGITQNTLDATAAGKLGAAGSGYEAVSAVMQETEEKKKGTSQSRNFSGTMQQVKIYNHNLY
jgi:hypothetical protein